MSRTLRLDEFQPGAEGPDPEELKQQLIAARNEGHARGIREGAEASARAHAEAQDRLRLELVEAMRDAQMSFQEVESTTLAGVAPFLRAVIAHVAPAIAVAGLAEAVAKSVEAGLANRTAPKPLVKCAPDAKSALESALSRWPGGIAFDPDPTLTPFEAEVHWGGGFDAVDTGALLEELDAILAGFSANDRATMNKETQNAG